MNSSAASTRRSFSEVIGSPYWKREERHANDGLSHVGSPSSRDSSRISAFVSSASISGARTPRCRADCMPGRWSPRSEEHPSELQSPDHLVCRLLLEKKNITYF